jgi:oligoendopeptidase F
MSQSTTAIESRFVSDDVDPGRWEHLQPLYQSLLDRSLASAESLEQWLADYSELSAVISEHGAKLNINHACHTDDDAVEKAYLDFVEAIPPKVKPYEFALKQKYLACPHREELGEDKFALIDREWQAEVDLYREANIALQTQATKKVSEYDRIAGAMTVEFRGETYTLQQLGRFLEDTDRQTREEAWTLSQERRLQDREPISDIFDELLSLRSQIATNADCSTYRDYIWQDKCRFDYTPDDCHAFAEAVAKHVVPAVEQLDRERRETLGVDVLRPWDLAVDAKGRPALEPFDRDDVQTLVSRTRAVFDRVEPTLGEQFARLQFGSNLDLASRKGKRGGGFQAAMLKSGEPFIFMNAAGLQRDVETMLHEAGHAFHFLWASEHEPLVFLRGAPMEFNEVASMSMELIAGDALEPFYGDQAQRDRAKRSLLEGALRVLPWIATIDQFQHWLYTNPRHTPEQRTEAWLSIHSQFASSEVDWAGYEQAQANLWQKQLHLFHAPFYYIEYGIAQLGALQLWQRYEADRDAALRDYRQALSLGGTRPLPKLFETAGLTFDFSEKTIGPAVQAVQDALAKLPA